MPCIRWWQELKSTVYFAGIRARSPEDSKQNKIRRLFDAAGFTKVIKKGDLTAIKIHFGELGNDSYVNPVPVRPIAERSWKGGPALSHRHQYPLRGQSGQCRRPPARWHWQISDTPTSFKAYSQFDRL